MKTFNRLSISVLILVTLSVSGCKEPEITVNSLSAGKPFPPPVLLNHGIVNAFPSTQKYLRFSGSCHAKVSGFEIAYFEGSPATLGSYNSIAAFEFYDLDGDGTSDTTFTNDLNCSDLTFDFVLSIDTIFSHLGVSTVPDLESKSVEAIYIRGTFEGGLTSELILPTSNGSSSKPTSLSLETEDYFRVIPSNENCVKIEVEIIGDNNHPIDTNKIDNGSYEIQATAGGTTTPLEFFQSKSDCTTNSDPSPYQVFSSSGAGREVYLNLGSMDGLFQLQAVNATIQYDGNDYLLSNTARTFYRVPPTESTTSRFLSMPNFPRKLLHNKCYGTELKYVSNDDTHDTGFLNSEVSGLYFKYSVLDAKGDLFGSETKPPFKVYTQSDCTTVLNSVPLSWTDTKTTVYIKYVDGGTSREFDSARIKIEATIPAFGTTLRPTSRWVESHRDTNPDPVFAKIFDNITDIPAGSCQNIELKLESSNNSLTTSAGPLTVNVSTDKIGSHVKFYQGADCTAGSNHDSLVINFDSSQFSRKLSYRIIQDFSGGFQLKTQIASNPLVQVYKTAQSFNLSGFSISVTNFLTKDSCYPLTITPSLPAGTIALPTLFDFDGGGYFEFYPDTTCTSAAIVAPQLLNPITDFSYEVYIKPINSGSNLSVVINHSGGSNQIGSGLVVIP